MTRVTVNTSKFLTATMLALLVINCCFLLWYVFIGYQNYFHSDSAAKVLLAREIYNTSDFFPDDWNYVNSDLFIIFGHAIVVPLLAFAPAGFTVHAISGVIFSGLILHGLWLLTSLGNTPPWQRIAIVAAFASGISGFMAENLYGQVSYGVTTLLCCYIVYTTSKILSSERNKIAPWAAIFFTVLLLVYWANPKRALITYSIPLTCALSYLFLIDKEPAKKTIFFIFILMSAAATVGSLLHLNTISGVNNIAGASNASLLSFEGVLSNINLSIKGIYAQLGGLPLAGASIYSGLGLYTLLRFAFATLIIILTPFAIAKGSLNEYVGIRLLAIFSASVFVSTFLLQTTTSIADMRDPIQSSRYMIPGVVLCLVVFLMKPIDLKTPTAQTIILTMILALFGISAMPVYRMSDLNSGLVLAQPGQLDTQRRDLVKILKDRGLEYGYATYWNAGAVSVLSNEKVLVRQIQLRGGLPVPMHHLSSKKWYKPTAWQGKTFLLLHESEVPHLNPKRMESVGAQLEEQFKVNAFVIQVYSDNIARHLPGWDTRYEQSTAFRLHDGVLTRIGRLAEDPTGQGMVLEADASAVGALHYGPYIYVEPGRYRVTFDVSAAQHTEPVMRLDVAASPGQKLYGERLLTGSDMPQVIEFTLPEARKMEFRVWALGREKVVYRGLTLERLGEADDISIRPQ